MALIPSLFACGAPVEEEEEQPPVVVGEQEEEEEQPPEADFEADVVEGEAPAIITEAWIKSYTGISDDGFFGVAIDSQNNVIVTGLSWNASGTGNDDYLTIKYDSNGNVQWMKSYTVKWDDRAFGVAVDSQNNVIVTGAARNAVTGNDDYLTIKYDSNGNVQWMKSYSGAGNDYAFGVAVDSQNNVIVTGGSYNAGRGNYDFLTIKYDSNGNVQWMRSYTGAGNDPAFGVAVDSKNNVIADSGFGAAVDSQNNVIVTGRSYNAGTGNWDYLTIKYDSNGNVQWMKSYSGAGNDSALGVAVDSQNNVIVTGGSYNARIGNSDFLTIKYDSNGNVQWMRNYSGAGNDEALGVAVDSQNNVIVTGHSRNASGTGSGDDYLTIKYDSNGNVQWMKSYTGTSNDWAFGVAVDSQNNVIVTGVSYNAAGTGNHDSLTIKYVETSE